LGVWDEIRLQAREQHARALEVTNGDASIEALLTAAATLTGVKRFGLRAGHPLLFNSHAVLHSNKVWFNRELELWQTQFNQAHEYAHFWRHGEGTLGCTHDAEATEDTIALGAQRVEGYSPHERRELEANVYAREYLLPSDRLRERYLSGENAETIANSVGLPIYVVIHQMTLALLGVELQADATLEQQGAALEGELDSSQKRAAFSGAEEAARGERELPVLVDAGPGTGKTRTLVGRVIHLLHERRVLPTRILALTYSNKAAEEMYSRIKAAATHEASHIWIGTFHSFGLELIRKHHDRLGIGAKPTIIDPIDTQLMLEQSLGRLNLQHYRSLKHPTMHLRAMLDAISLAKDYLVSPAEYARLAQEDLKQAGDDKEEIKRAEQELELARVYEVYETLLAERQCLDYGDLIYKAVRLLEEYEDLRNQLEGNFSHILVDEYQDVNTASRLLLKHLAGDGSGLWVVGDLRQAIYRFRGASPVNMMLLTTEDFPDAKVLPLGRNYRSQRPVIEVFAECATRMRANARGEQAEWEVERATSGGEVRFKVSADENQEAAEMVEEIERLREEGVAYREQAVLCRTHDQLSHFSNALEDAGVPVLYFGNFLERPEVRDLLSVVSLASEPDGHALFRLARFDEYQISFADVKALTTHAHKNRYYFPQALLKVQEAAGISSDGRAVLTRLAGQFADYDFGATAWLVLVQYLFVRSEYLRSLVGVNTAQAQQKRLAIYQLLLLAYALRERFAGETGDHKRLFLDYVRRMKVSGEERQLRQTPAWADSIDAVRMLTIHSAKGLEFSAVHLPNLSEKQFPSYNRPPKCQPPPEMLPDGMSDWYEEEEECLFFVALSRARDRLCILRARSYDGRRADASRLLRLVQAKLPPALAKLMPRPNVRAAPPPVVVPGVPPRFTERELCVYMECPLKYYYQFVLGISERRSNLPHAQAHLCVYRVWQFIDNEIDAGREINEVIVAAKLEEVWQEQGPSKHAYEEDYRAEAEEILRRTVDWRAAAGGRNLRPHWAVQIEGCEVIVRPDRAEVIADATGETTLLVQHLSLGTAPTETPQDDFYTLFAIAAEQLGLAQTVTVQAVYMTTGETWVVSPSRRQRTDSLLNYRKAIQGILREDYSPRPKNKYCPYCAAYYICPSVDAVKVQRVGRA
jgi:DNA helicase-2/ATP-dependent DNA helicase PcrA